MFCAIKVVNIWCNIGFIGFDGFDVRKIDDHEYTVEISCYFLTKWRDDRLGLSEEILSKRRRKHLNQSTLELEVAQQQQNGTLHESYC